MRIDISKVTEVLIAGTWYEVVDDSFDLDSYEFMEKGRCLHGGGQYGICASGYTFRYREPGDHEGVYHMSGPLTAVQAVRHLP